MNSKNNSGAKCTCMMGSQFSPSFHSDFIAFPLPAPAPSAVTLSISPSLSRPMPPSSASAPHPPPTSTWLAPQRPWTLVSCRLVSRGGSHGGSPGQGQSHVFSLTPVPLLPAHYPEFWHWRWVCPCALAQPPTLPHLPPLTSSPQLQLLGVEVVMQPPGGAPA